MNLATRLSAFFLIALAVVLAGFSIALVLLAESYFTRQMDTRLVAALETLQAAVDVESDGLTWHPADDRPITIGIEYRARSAALGGGQRPGADRGPIGQLRPGHLSHPVASRRVARRSPRRIGDG